MSNIELDGTIKRRQDIVGWVFVVMFISQFVFQLLIYTGVLSFHAGWYATVVGLLAVFGFILLYRLASDMSSDLFAMSMAAIELFFVCCRTYVLRQQTGYGLDNPSLLYLSAGFSLIELYTWSIFLHNCQFKSQDLVWYALLPLPIVLNVIAYGGYIVHYEGYHCLASAISQHKSVMTLMRMSVAVFMPWAFWRLAHNPCFSGRTDQSLDMPSVSPFNAYFLSYIALAGIFYLPLDLLR